MRRIARILIFTSVAVVLALPSAGCDGTANEESMKGTKGTAAPNPPASQKEFYEQQKAAAEAAGAGKKKK